MHFCLTTYKEIYGFNSNGQHYKEATEAIKGMGNELDKLRKNIDSRAFSGDALDAAKSLYKEVQIRKDQLMNIINQARKNAKEFE